MILIFDTTILFDVQDFNDVEVRRSLEGIGKEFVEYAKKRLEEVGAVYKIHGGKIRRAYRHEVLLNSKYLPKKKHKAHAKNTDRLGYYRNWTLCDGFAKVDNVVDNDELVDCKRCRLRIEAAKKEAAKEEQSDHPRVVQDP